MLKLSELNNINKFRRINVIVAKPSEFLAEATKTAEHIKVNWINQGLQPEQIRIEIGPRQKVRVTNTVGSRLVLVPKHWTQDIKESISRRFKV